MNQRVRELFAAPPEEFVRVRDALVKELRAGGHDAEAKEVAALRRPTAAVWAVNQLSRKHRTELDDFIEASDRVRHAQTRGAAAEELRAAMAAQRSTLARLEEAAGDILREAGTQASPAALRTVQSTLQAAASGPGDARDQLREGTVREALEPAGFEALLGAKPAPRPARHSEPARGTSHEKPAHDRGAREREEKAQRRAADREAKRQAAEARKRARAVAAAEARLRKLEQKAKAAEEAATRAREAIVEARTALQRLRS
jgi:hypothetical protein